MTPASPPRRLSQDGCLSARYFCVVWGGGGGGGGSSARPPVVLGCASSWGQATRKHVQKSPFYTQPSTATPPSTPSLTDKVVEQLGVKGKHGNGV